MSVVEKAVAWAVCGGQPANGYDQTNRWGPDYDCSSFVISAFSQAGLPVREKGATYTGNMRPAFLAAGFRDVTGSVQKATGTGLQRGDVLLNIAYHTALHIGSGRLVQAAGNEKGGITGGKPGDQTGGEIGTAAYYDYPWDCILRYTGDDAGTEPDPGGTYTVQAGDTLSGIALRLLGDAQRYKELAALNKLADPSKIYPGQVLTLPGGGTETGKGEITLPDDTGGRRGRRGAVPAASFNSQVGHLLRRRRRRRGIWPGHGSCRAKLSDGPKAGRHRRRGRGHLAGPSGLRKSLPG